jgi:arabinan endo-1,5-alpha-L-arabinosidase
MQPCRTTLSVVFLAFSLYAHVAAQEAELPKVPRFHDPSTPIRHGDTWWIFSTGNGILSRFSQDLKTWSEGEPVFQEFPAWHRELLPAQKGHLWAPDIIRHNGTYHLYYSVSGWGKNTSAIGLATNQTLDPKDPDFRWKDRGIVIRSTPEDDYNAIDPHLFADDDGSLWMTFGSFWKGIQLIELDPATGNRHPTRREVRQLAWSESIEAPAILKHEGYYYLFVNWGLCCRGIKSTYEIRVGRSRKITGPFLDADGNDLSTGGGTLYMKSEGDKIGPGHPSFMRHNGKTHLFFHYYHRQRNGSPTLGDAPLRWNKEGWPENEA